MSLITSYVVEGDTIVDIGGNIGYYTIWAAMSVGSAGKVFTFEPDPINYGDLERNVALNNFQNVELCPVALSDHTGQSFIAHDYNNTGSSHLTDGLSGVNGFMVTVATLDDYLRGKDVDSIKLLKIDTEGSELQVLKGAEGYLRSDLPPYLLIEVIDEALKQFDASEKQLVQYLADFDYVAYNITKQGILSKYQPFDHNANLLFVPQKRMAKI